MVNHCVVIMKVSLKDLKSKFLLTYSSNFFSFFVVPKPVQELHIINPHNKQLIFYNSLLKELYDDIYEIISPVQFVQYLLSQRILRWQIVKGSDQVKQFDENAIQIIQKMAMYLTLKNILLMIIR